MYSVSRRVTLTGGSRYTGEQKDLETLVASTGSGRLILAVPDTFYDFVDNATFHAWTPKASFQVQASRDTFVYVQPPTASRAADSTRPRGSRARPSGPSLPGVMKVA